MLCLEEEEARKSLSKQALQSCPVPEMGEQVYLKNNILLEAQPVHRGHCSICEALAALQRHGLSQMPGDQKSLNNGSGALCTGLLRQESLAHGADLPPYGPTMVLLSKRTLFGAGRCAIP